MAIHLIIFGTLFAVGIFFLLADILKLPTIAAEKAIAGAANINRKKVSSIEVMISDFGNRLAKHLSLNEYKRARLKNALISAGISRTPEEFTAVCILKAGLIGLFIIPCLIIFPLAAPVLLVLAIYIYFKEIGGVDEMLKDKRERIESELPRFTATLTQELRHSRDVLRILENYKHSAGVEFAKELDILTADMRSGGYETALTRFEARLNSPLLSDIVRGLISVLRGDDGAVYFQMLTHDMKQLELQKLKMKAMKIPDKIRKFSFVMLVCFMMTYLVVIISQILTSMSTLF